VSRTSGPRGSQVSGTTVVHAHERFGTRNQYGDLVVRRNEGKGGGTVVGERFEKRFRGPG
jgi:hypothetical protein